MELLGSRFIAHPANQRIKIRVTDVKHPLTPAMEDFEVEDEEPYYCEPLGEQLVLLEASYSEPSVGICSCRLRYRSGKSPANVYTKLGIRIRALPLLGHCAGKHDMKPIADIAPISRLSWNSPTYSELLRRGINWGIGSL